MAAAASQEDGEAFLEQEEKTAQISGDGSAPKRKNAEVQSRTDRELSTARQNGSSLGQKKGKRRIFRWIPGI